MEREIAAELADHIERLTADNIRAGMNADEARRAARVRLGPVEGIKEDCREARGAAWLESTLQDIRFAARTLSKSRGFTVTAILMLALGIGANAAIFELFDAVRLRSLPVRDPNALALVSVRGGNGGFGVNSGNDASLTYPLWRQIHDHQRSFSEMFAWRAEGSEIGEGSHARNAAGVWASGGFFDTLGVNPVRGRFFREEDDRPGCGLPGAVISHALWQSEFGGADSAIGKSITIEDHPVAVIGVAPASFSGVEVGMKFDFVLPMCSIAALQPGDPRMTRLDYFWLHVIGRRKPGVTLAQAASEMDALTAGIIAATTPTGYSTAAIEQYQRFRLTATAAGTGVSDLRSTYDNSLLLLLGITGLVLLIACANVASLMLTRASTRELEMAVRRALGASRWRLIRQLLAEGALLSVSGALFGAAVAGALGRTLVRFLSLRGDEIDLDVGLDARVLVFIVTVAITTCVIFGLAPAFRSSNVDPGDALKSGSRGTTAGSERFSFQRWLVTSQIAISLVLLVGAALFVQSFWKLTSVNPGFRVRDVVCVYLSFGKANVPASQLGSFSRDLLEDVRAIPQVESAAVTTHLPFAGSWTSRITVNGKDAPSKFTWASPDYFKTLSIPLIAGRDFTAADTQSSPHVAVVSESFMRTFTGGANPIGQIIHTASEPYYPATTYEIVGVVKDQKYSDLREVSAPPEAYAPYEQFPPGPGPWMAVLVDSRMAASALIPAIRAKMNERNAEISVDDDVLEEEIQTSLVGDRIMAMLSGFFGILAALLTMVGLYGVISYFVALRRNEIGIRIALGADPAKIVSMILRETIAMVGLGAGIGLGLSVAAAKSVATLVFGLKPSDPLTLAGSAAALIAVAALASYVPARRASRIEPMIALRHD
jgi:predicted permease